MLDGALVRGCVPCGTAAPLLGCSGGTWLCGHPHIPRATERSLGDPKAPKGDQGPAGGTNVAVPAPCHCHRQERGWDVCVEGLGMMLGMKALGEGDVGK